MPFRERAKALFRPKLRGSSSSSSSSRKDSDIYYKPHEMPRPKYRAIPTKEHKENLESFSFAEAWRRKSFQSQYSPMGTRAPSRRGSFLSLARRKSQRSVHSNLRHSRNNSVTSGDGEKAGTRQRENIGHGAAIATTLSTEVEAEGDDDVTNVGVSRVQSRDRVPTINGHKHTMSGSSHLTVPDNETTPQPQASAGAEDDSKEDDDSHDIHHDSGAQMIENTAHDHQPFTEHDLALALKRSHLAVPVN